MKTYNLFVCCSLSSLLCCDMLKWYVIVNHPLFSATEPLIFHQLSLAMVLHTPCPSLIMCLLWGGECRTHPTNRIGSCLNDSFIHPFPIAATCVSNINKCYMLFLLISFNCIVEEQANTLAGQLIPLLLYFILFYFLCVSLLPKGRGSFEHRG